MPVLIGVSLTAVVLSRAEASSGCGTVDGPIAESDTFTPYESTLGHLPELPIDPTGRGPSPVPADAEVASIGGLPRRLTVVSGNGAVYQYFLETEIGSEMTLADFHAAGGVELDRDPAGGNESYPEYLLDFLDDRAVEVQVGDHTGALTWADPDINGLRPHHLSWTDGEWNYALIADRSAEELLSLARDLVCGGKIGG